jgi:hypothetical protein
MSPNPPDEYPILATRPEGQAFEKDRMGYCYADIQRAGRGWLHTLQVRMGTRRPFRDWEIKTCRNWTGFGYAVHGRESFRLGFWVLYRQLIPGFDHGIQSRFTGYNGYGYQPSINWFFGDVDTLPVKTGEILGSTRHTCRSKSDSLSASVFCLRVPHGDNT